MAGRAGGTKRPLRRGLGVMESKAREIRFVPLGAALGKAPGRDPGGRDGTGARWGGGEGQGGTGGRGLGRRTVTRSRGHKILFVRMLLK